MGKWRRTGIIWWNLIDGWPQISDAVVDYYGTKKLAYQYIRRSQRPVCLMFGEPEDGVMTLYGVNDTQSEVRLDYTVTELGSGTEYAVGRASLPANSSIKLWDMPYTGSAKLFLLIKWSGGAEGINHHMAGMPGLDLYEYTALARRAGYEL